MEKLIIESKDKKKLELLKQLLNAMQIGFEIVPYKKDEQSLLKGIGEGYLEAKEIQNGNKESKSYSSFSEIADDL